MTINDMIRTTGMTCTIRKNRMTNNEMTGMTTMTGMIGMIGMTCMIWMTRMT